MAGLTFDVTLKGADAMIAKLQQIGATVPQAMQIALYDEAQAVRTDSMEHTPVDTGALKASHTVSVPEVHGREASVTIGVGGPAAPYAVFVHENLDARHPVGEAKFLERAVLRSVNSFAARVAFRLRRAGLLG